MNTRTTYVFLSIVCPIFFIAGIASMFGFGIPEPYGYWAFLLGVCTMVYSQRQAKRLHEEGKPSGFVPATLEQKKRNFWIYVVAIAVGAGTFAFWFPGSNPGIPPIIFWVSAVMSFAMCTAILWYAMFKKKP
ncbi:MAG: hypothetical protein LV481_00255 [Methylacidiphilales bacterium]|nr:hypothetical protein [Candidatus Methylacidiphilales bacterium]